MYELTNNELLPLTPLPPVHLSFCLSFSLFLSLSSLTKLFCCRILPVNDRPVLSLNEEEEGVLRMPAESRLTLPRDLLELTDPDTRLDQIIILVTYNDSRYTFERVSQSCRPVKRSDLASIQ